MARRKKSKVQTRQFRDYTKECKKVTVRMILDGHTAMSVVERMGISNANVLQGNRMFRRLETLGGCPDIALGLVFIGEMEYSILR